MFGLCFLKGSYFLQRPHLPYSRGGKRLFLFLFVAFFSFLAILNSPLSAASYPAVRDVSGSGLAITSDEYATKIGKAVLDSGGNAIDAAVAVGYALAVVHPAAGNIGGGGFAIIHLADGKNLALDFREVAPLGSKKDMFLDKKGNVVPNASVVGHLAAGVPGSVKGMSAMLEKYGTKSLNELIAPAIDLAENGFVVNDRQEQTFAEAKENLSKFASSRAYFLKKDGSTYKSGETLVQKDLAKSLRLIQKEGESAFYKGKIADMIVADMQNNGGIITKEDLANYKVIWREPVRGTYRGYEIISMSPPSSGGTHILQILNVLENADIKKLGFNSADTIHIMTEAMRQAYADRSVFMGDPDFWSVPLDSLLSREYAKKIYTNILKANKKAMVSKDTKPGLGMITESGSRGSDSKDSKDRGLEPKILKEGNHTTHYSVVDKQGNAVSVTYTINGSYGSYAAVSGAGFLLNNEMDDFAIKPGVANLYGLVGSDANAIVPGKRPLSSMSPTIVLKDNELFMVVGSPGGARIITTVLQVISNVIDHGMPLNVAVSSSRFHHQWSPEEVRTESFGLSKDTANILEKMGYKLSEQPDMGDVNAIIKDPKNGAYYGVSDPRKEF